MDLQKPQSIWSLRIRGTWAHKASTKKWKLSENDKSILVEIVEENHLASLSEITAQMRDITLDDVSESTIRRALHVAGTLDMLEQGSPSSARSIVKNVLTGH